MSRGTQAEGGTQMDHRRKMNQHLVEDGSSASRGRRIAWKGDGSPGQGDLRVGGRAVGRRRTALQQGGVAGSGDARRGIAR